MNVATYNQAGVLFDNLKKINFIYGVNGSGKTTLTKLVANSEDPIFNKCTVTWKNNVKLSALVYNKDFRDKNFGKGKIDGVFTIGQATKEEQRLIEEKIEQRKSLKEDVAKRKDTLQKKTEDLQEKDNSFRDIAWVEVYKAYENVFSDAFVGFKIKENFKNKLIEEFTGNKSALLDYETLAAKAKTIFGSAPETLARLSIPSFSRILEIEKDDLWAKKILGKADVDIAKLIQRLNLNDWVNEGRKFIEPDNQTCPFCQQSTITKTFIEQLEDYFDASFIEDTANIKRLAEEYILLTKNCLNFLQQIENGEKTNKSSKLDKEKFSAYLKTFSSQLTANGILLENKGKEPSRSIKLESVKKQLEELCALITTANTEINAHNEIVANFSKERQTLIKNVWRFLTDKHKTLIDNFVNSREIIQKAIKGITDGITEAERKYKELDKDIKERSKNVTSVQPSIDEINRTLQNFGFHNFLIVPYQAEANKYQIQRENGDIADATLSEGEITFITFLYFLQLTRGGSTESNITEDRILVIDDPISSLDSNVLFIVSSLLKEIIKQIKADRGSIKQLILLTHNVYFHKEVSFVDRGSASKEIVFWMLRKNNQVTNVQCYGEHNPIKNSYELLWHELKNKEQNSAVTLQNTMRRIIENYFSLLGSGMNDKLLDKFEINEDKAICRSLLSWINDGSHSIPDDLFVEHAGDMTDRYLEVFKKVFEHTEHLEHYNMMMTA
ncbi:AAA family ATPase [Mucilaginibacter sp. HC2]|uniref:AAA family ATPase n=1 Tax=Mucilaginibacter inviolabilis TaxID=2714892 RepID=UPI00140C67E1|nr:AAA family ATPase [Mucilaginibacter inviolabilis]NHA03461.1 AAA family ATPase [Mucilaginibacter inviolabilis]